jgi:N-hydroxyarylamine O-acetyltransferase
MGIFSRNAVQQYLERIGHSDGLTVSTASLRKLQRAHLLNVPFENLDIYWKQTIKVDVERFFQKIVAGRRGGFCYELNGLFSELLKAIGFETRLISARVFSGDVHGPEFDHAAIISTIGGEEFITDVGFGDFASEPLRFVTDVEQHDSTGTFMIRRFDGKYHEVVKRTGDEWVSQYIFTAILRELSDFKEMCAYHQTSPESHFTKGAVCSILTESGRKTLTDKKLIVTTADQKHEQPVESELSFYNLLKKEFGIEKPTLS